MVAVPARVDQAGTATLSTTRSRPVMSPLATEPTAQATEANLWRP